MNYFFKANDDLTTWALSVGSCLVKGLFSGFAALGPVVHIIVSFGGR